MELKTLKDMTWTPHSQDEVVSMRDLKEEAIKWIQYCGDNLDCNDFMKFHNITEEELK